MLGLVPTALTACVETEAAIAQPISTVPAVGVDLGSSSRVPQIAGLAGEGEGYGRTEPGTTPTAHGSTPEMAHEAGMQMGDGSMPIMDPGSMTGMSHASTGGMPMDHGSMPGMSHRPQAKMASGHGSMAGMDHAAGRKMQIAHSGHSHAQGTGTVNSVDAAAHKINVSHGPIPTIGFPAMTMDFAVAPTVDLRAVQPGIRINFTIEQGEGGVYVIQSVAPAGGGRK
jgi:Cu(I)/Ag(I) efflux system protein CusF